MVPRKRRRTRLSIPLGFLQLGSTRMKRSDWWRKKRAVPVKGFLLMPLFLTLMFFMCCLWLRFRISAGVGRCSPVHRRKKTTRSIVHLGSHQEISSASTKNDVPGARRSEFQNNPSILFQAFETCRFQRQTHGGWIKRTLLHDRDVLLGGDHLKTKVSIIATNWSNFFKRGSNSMEQ